MPLFFFKVKLWLSLCICFFSEFILLLRKCFAFEVFHLFKDTITDVVSTLEFGISYRLPERTEPIPTPFPGALPDINTYPILDAGLTGEESMVITTVEFAKKCGANDECESNLIMDVSLDLRHDTNGKPVIEQGITKELRVMVTIENTYEVAYQIMFYFTKPETLEYKISEPVSITISLTKYSKTCLK